MKNKNKNSRLGL